MLIRHADRGSVERAAEHAYVQLSPITYDRRTNGYRLTLKPRGDAYRRYGQNETATGKQRRINAVCYHGYLAYMRELYRLVPGAIIMTSMATYRSATELEAKKYEAAERNVGTQDRPLRYQDLCTCSDYNVGGVVPVWQADGTTSYQ